MSTLIPTPKFHNTVFHSEDQLNPSGSHHDRETIHLISTIPSNSFGIASIGHSGISLAKIVKNPYIFVPTPLPYGLALTLQKYTNKVKFFGNNFTECYELADDYMHNHGITNISPDKVARYIADIPIVDEILTRLIPKYVFIPSSNFDLAVGILEGFKRRNHKPTIVICVLPDHFLSPRFNYTYDRTPYLTSITYNKHFAPGLNKLYKQYDNYLIKTVKNPDYVYQKYHDLFPNIDPINYIAMEISETFKSNERKVIVTTGKNLIEHEGVKNE